MPTISKNLQILFASRMLRLFACGLFAVVLALYLDGIGLTGAQIGLVMALTFLGDAVISLWLAIRADRLGRRLTLRLGAILMVVGGVGIAMTHDLVLLTIAATIGVISPTGAEVGPFLSIEQACVAHIVDAKRRTQVFAWYHVAGFTMSALGALTGGAISHVLQVRGWSAVESYRVLFWLYAGCGVVIGALSYGLNQSVEDDHAMAASKKTEPSSGPLGLGSSQALVLRLSALFALDSFGGGFCVQSFLAWWFHQRLGASEAALGTVFFGTNLLSGISALVAVPLARRFGLIATMVWTHLPSSLLLMLVPLMPNFTAAMVVLWLRNSISQMDVPTRASYVNAVVPSHIRSAANGVTTTAKQLGTSVAPLLAGPLLASSALMNLPFWICGGTKIIYDLLLWRAFRHVKPEEESQSSKD